MKEKRLAASVAYYWEPHQRDRANGCTLRAEALGRDYATATERAAFLNLQLDAWRGGRGSVMVEDLRPGFGSVAWLFDGYLKSTAFLNRVSERSRYEYRRALDRIRAIPTTTGGTVGDLPAASISPGAADKIYDKLQTGPRGKRRRQANLSIDIARRAWKVMRRRHPAVVPADNPWGGIERDLRKTAKPAASRTEAYALAQALRDLGEPALGAAPLICFEWHQRPEHVLAGDITWADYRPPQRRDAVFIRHPKTDEKGWTRLEDERGEPLYPEIEDYLAAVPRAGLPIVLTSGKRGPSRPFSNEHAERLVRKARTNAKLGAHVTLDSCRHGGLTELGDSGATEAETMAAAHHKTPQANRGYIKRTETQRLNAAVKRRAHVEKNKTGAKVGMSRQTKSGNDEP